MSAKFWHQDVRKALGLLSSKRSKPGPQPDTASYANNNFVYHKLEIEPPYNGLLSSSCQGLQPLAATELPFGLKSDFASRTDRRPKGQTDNGFQGVI